MNWTDKIQVYNEDCMETMARYEDGWFDLAIVDPPYGIGEANGKNASRNKGFGTGSKKSKKVTFSKDYGKKDWDDKPPPPEYFKELFRVSKNQILWGANHFIENLPYQNASCWIIWDKLNGDSDFADCEMAWTSFKKTVRKFTFRWNGMLQGDMKNKEQRIHPTQKPVALYNWILDRYAKPDFKILDTHLGSGSHAIACHHYGCELVAAELDTDYYNYSHKRFILNTAQQKLF